MLVTDLPRNDVAAALRFLEEALDAGSLTSDDGEVLAMLHDEPEQLEVAVEELLARRKDEGRPLGPFAEDAPETGADAADI